MSPELEEKDFHEHLAVYTTTIYKMCKISRQRHIKATVCFSSPRA